MQLQVSQQSFLKVFADKVVRTQLSHVAFPPLGKRHVFQATFFLRQKNLTCWRNEIRRLQAARQSAVASPPDRIGQSDFLFFQGLARR